MSVGRLLDDVEHIRPERRDELAGVDGADPPDHARSQIFLDAFGCRRRTHAQELCPKLETMVAIIGPGSGGLNRFTRRYHRSLTDEGDQVPLPSYLHAQHAEAAVGIMEGDALNQAAQLFA